MENERKRLEIIALEIAGLLSLWATKEQRLDANDKVRQLAQGFGYKLAARRDPDADPWRDEPPGPGFGPARLKQQGAPLDPADYPDA